VLRAKAVIFALCGPLFGLIAGKGWFCPPPSANNVGFSAQTPFGFFFPPKLQMGLKTFFFFLSFSVVQIQVFCKVSGFFVDFPYGAPPLALPRAPRFFGL